MESTCPICKKPYDGVVCSQCTVTDLDVSGLMASEGLQVASAESSEDSATAFLVDLVSNRKIPITTPRCKVGRDDLNDIVISGDQSISRFHFVISKENNQYLVQDGKSRHGTFLNGNQISEPESIRDGDVLKVGVSLFWFVIESGTNSDESNKGPSQIRAGQDLEFTVPSSDASIVASKDTEATLAVPKVSPNEVSSVKSETTDDTVASKSDNGKSTVPAKNGKGKSESRSKVESTKSEKDKEFEGETFSADPNSPEQTQSSLLNAISESIQGVGSNSAAAEATSEAKVKKEEETKNKNAENASKTQETKGTAKMSKLRRFDPDSLINQDEDYPLGDFTFFEPLTAQPTDDLVTTNSDEAAPVDSSATSEFVPYDASAYETQEAEANAIAARAARQEQVESEASIKPEAEPTETDAVAEVSAKAESEATDTAEISSEISSEISAEISEEISAEASTALSAETSDETTAKDDNSAATLDKFAEIVGEASSPGDAKKTDEERLVKEEREELSKAIGEIQTNQPDRLDHEGPEKAEIGEDSSQSNQEEKHTNGAKSPMSKVTQPSAVVPDWCKKYFSSELSDLGKELTELNEQVREAQQKIQDVQSRVALTRGLRNVLLSSQGEELVEGCSKVLKLLGWEVKVSEDDKHELRLNGENKDVCIASIVWTATQADRTHLAQLSISQTRFWCEQGTEPKGILIVSKASDSEPEPLTKEDFKSELAEYAKKKNVCLMTTMQLLSIYKEVALDKGDFDKVREKMSESSGWLEGFKLEPGELMEEEEEIVVEEKEKEGVSSNKLSSLLSA